MSHANSALQVTELDFNNIRSSLKTFLSSQTNFVDYDFDGSNISVLLDLLAYNTHYNSFYLNMVANEMFLNSAQLRNNVIERANEIGYTTTSVKGAVAEITLTIVPTDTPDTISVPKNTAFTTTVDDEVLTFTTTVGHVITKSSSDTYVLSGIELAEGLPLTHEFTVDDSNPVDYILPNKNVDLNRITVSVKETAGSTTSTVYTLENDLTEVTGTSTIYFLEEAEDEKYRIYFGDDILGKSVNNGNVIVVDYHVCNTTKGNGATDFTSLAAISGYSNITATTTTTAVGGHEIETIDSIKLNAPLHFERQNRAVTEKDYERFIMSENTDFTSVNVWGGEENDPPIYGRVYIAVNPSGTATIISDARKDLIVASLQTRNVLSIDPVVVDASFLFIVPTVQVNWNPDQTSKNAGTIESEVLNSITTYQTSDLDDFGKKFRFSSFSTAIDNTDNSIQGNMTTIKMKINIIPTVNVSSTYTIDFRNALPSSDVHDVHDGHVGTVQSTSFVLGGLTSFIEDDGNGLLRTYTSSGGVKTIVNTNIGTVNYTTGLITLSAFAPTSVNNNGVLSFTSASDSNDVIPSREQIIRIVDSTITTVEDRN
tara:strand:+ start:3458 stop:5248 length:1791 start_codon:yes stop_codon:yes gene_type:complete